MPPALTFFSRICWPLRPASAIVWALPRWFCCILRRWSSCSRTEDDLVAAAGVPADLGPAELRFGLRCCAARRSPAALSLMLIVVLILLSQFKQDILIMSANFIDVLLIDADTISFLLTVVPRLCAAKVGDRRRGGRCRCSRCCGGSIRSACGCGVAALGARCLCVGADRRCRSRCRWTARRRSSRADYVSQFARSGALALFDVATRGLLDSDAHRHATACPRRAPPACKPGQRLPHIILVLDELSFDISAVPGVKVPPGYQSHFRSFDGKERNFAGRRRRRPDLVHRIQRAERPVGALVTAASPSSSRASPPAASRGACRTRCTTAAIAPTASIPGSAPF